MGTHRRQHSKRAMALATAVLTAVTLSVVVVPAHASRCDKAAVNQYSEQCHQPGGSQGHNGQGHNGEGRGVSGGGASGSIGGGGGHLPFTGYPLTTLIEILAGMLLLGILIRTGMASADRYRATRAATAGASISESRNGPPTDTPA